MSEQFKAGQKVRIIGNTESGTHYLKIGTVAGLVSGVADEDCYGETGLFAYEVEGISATTGNILRQFIERCTFEIVES